MSSWARARGRRRLVVEWGPRHREPDSPTGELVPEQIDPPTADHIEPVLRLVPSKYVLPVLWLDHSAHRVTAGVDKLTVGDWDLARSRVRARAETTKTRQALWREVPPALGEAIERSLPPRDDRDLAAPLFPGVKSTALRTAIAKACRAAGVPLWSPHDLKHRRISLLHAQGKTWAEIAELVDRSPKVLADTYTHVLMDEREIDYAAAIADRLGPPAEAPFAGVGVTTPGRSAH